MEAQQLEVEYEATDALVPYARNAKIHTAEQVGQIANSIREFGFNDPIAVWTNADGESEIVEGHGRVLAAKEMGMESVPVIHLDRMTDEQRRAYTHVHNQLTMTTGWDFGALDADLDELDFDFGEFGFDETTLDDEFGTAFTLPDGDSPCVSRAIFILAPEQRDRVMEILSHVDVSGVETFGNSNRNGNALYRVVTEWEGLRM